MCFRVWTSVLCGALFSFSAAAPAHAVTNYVISWKRDGLAVIRPELTNVAMLSTEYSAGVAVRRDGTLVNWPGQLQSSLSNIIAVAGAYGLRWDGVAVGLGTGLVRSNAVAVGAVYSGGVVLLRDGTVERWGTTSSLGTNAISIPPVTSDPVFLRADGALWTQASYPAAVRSRLTNIVSFAASRGQLAFLHPNGVAGYVERGYSIEYPQVFDCIAVATGAGSPLALTKRGEVKALGISSSTPRPPSGLSNVVTLACGLKHYLALRADGTVVAWDTGGPYAVPPSVTNVSAIFASDNESFAIIGQSPPMFQSRLPNVTAWTSKSAVFATQPVAGFPMSLQWYHNGETIPGATNSWYHIANVRLEHAGVYTLLASNPQGIASVESMLRVQPGVYFVTQPQGFTNLAGETKTLRVTASGTDKPFYQWYFNNAALPGATNTTLTFPRLGLADNGAYWVTASNSMGMTTSAVATVAWRAFAAGEPYPFTRNVPESLQAARAIAVGGGDCYAAIPDGRVLKWRPPNVQSPLYVPSFTNVVAMCAGSNYLLALREDGTVVEDWSAPRHELVPSRLSNVVAIATGAKYSLALHENGTIAAWGTNDYGPSRPPVGLGGFVSIAAGPHHCLALTTNGTIVGWGRNLDGESSTPFSLRRFVGIAAGKRHSVALREDGTLLAWGNTNAQAIPAGVTNIVAVAAGDDLSLALRADGKLITWIHEGYYYTYETPDVAAVAVSGSQIMIVTSEGLVVPAFSIRFPALKDGVFTTSVATRRGSTYYLHHSPVLNEAWRIEPPIPGDNQMKTMHHGMTGSSNQFYKIYRKPGG